LIRSKLPIRLLLLTIVVGFVALVLVFGRWLGLSEILIVGLLIVLLLLAEGMRVVVAGFIKGYRGEG
jgi:hypothetical protein